MPEGGGTGADIFALGGGRQRTREQAVCGVTGEFKVQAHARVAYLRIHGTRDVAKATKAVARPSTLRMYVPVVKPRQLLR